MKFKVGDKVRISKGSIDWVDVMDKYIGEEGEITFIKSDCFDYYINKEYIGHHLKINEKTPSFYFCEDSLQLVAEPSVPVFNQCPRCSGELYEKNTVDFGTIKKCRNCGWC